MKKLFTAMFSLAMIISLSVLTSCGGAPSNSDVKKVIEKYDDKGEISEKDYSALLDYLDAAMDEALPLVKDMKKAQENDDDDEIEAIEKKAEKLESKYEYFEDVLKIISNASDEDLGKSNVKKAKDLLGKWMKAMY